METNITPMLFGMAIAIAIILPIFLLSLFFIKESFRNQDNRQVKSEPNDSASEVRNELLGIKEAVDYLTEASRSLNMSITDGDEITKDLKTSVNTLNERVMKLLKISSEDEGQDINKFFAPFFEEIDAKIESQTLVIEQMRASNDFHARKTEKFIGDLVNFIKQRADVDFIKQSVDGEVPKDYLFSLDFIKDFIQKFMAFREVSVKKSEYSEELVKELRCAIESQLDSLPKEVVDKIVSKMMESLPENINNVSLSNWFGDFIIGASLASFGVDEESSTKKPSNPLDESPNFEGIAFDFDAIDGQSNYTIREVFEEVLRVHKGVPTIIPPFADVVLDDLSDYHEICNLEWYKKERKKALDRLAHSKRRGRSRTNKKPKIKVSEKEINREIIKKYKGKEVSTDLVGGKMVIKKLADLDDCVEMNWYKEAYKKAKANIYGKKHYQMSKKSGNNS